MGLGLLLVAVIVLLNAFFVLAEYSLVASRRAVLSLMAEEGSRRARSALRLKDQPLHFIGTSQLGVTVASILLGAIGEPVFARLFDSWLAGGFAFVLGLVLITYIHVTVGELTPKAVALARPERMALWCSLPLEALFRLTLPVVLLLQRSAALLARLVGVSFREGAARVSEEEIRLMLGEAGEGGAIEEAEEEMALKVLDFGDKEVVDVMVARPDVELLSPETTAREVFSRLREDRHALYPVLDAQGEVLGYVDIRDLAAAVSVTGLDEVLVGSALKPVHIVPETKNLLTLLSEFQSGCPEMAIIVDEYGQLSGIVTLMDLLEEIIGEVSDASLLERQPVSLGDGRVSLSGQFAIDEFNDLYGAALPEKDYRTMSGFVFGELGHAPNVGDEVAYGSFVFRVLVLDGTRIERLEIQLPSH